MCVISHKRRGFCGHFLTFQHKETQRIGHKKTDCLCWSCPHCAETTLRPELERHCLTIGKNAGKLHYLAIEASSSAWRRVYRQLERGRYFRLTLNGQYHVFSARALPGSSQHSGKALEKLLQRLIGEIPYGKSPWSSCRQWALKKRRTNHGCQIIAKSKVTAASLATAAMRQNVRHTLLGSNLTLSCDVPTAIGLLELAKSIQWAEAKRNAVNYPNVNRSVDKDNSPDDGRTIYTAVRSKPILAYDTSS